MIYVLKFMCPLLLVTYRIVASDAVGMNKISPDTIIGETNITLKQIVLLYGDLLWRVLTLAKQHFIYLSGLQRKCCYTCLCLCVW